MDPTITGSQLLLSVLGMLALVLAIIFIVKRQYAKVTGENLAEKHADQARNLAVKKYPEVDSFKNSGMFFRLGLALALGLTVLAFGWTQFEKRVDVSGLLDTLEDEIEIEPPRTAEPPPPPPPPPPPVIQEVPEELIEEEEQPQFQDQSIDDETEVVAPPPVVKEAAPPPPPPPPPPPEPAAEEIFRVVEEMPRFPGCESAGSAAEKKACADKKMLEYIYKNIKYPAIARENGVEGMTVITFVVEKDGKVTDAKIVKDIGAQCGLEALRVVNMMNSDGIVWAPGKQRGRPVRVQFNLPVRFKLE